VIHGYGYGVGVGALDCIHGQWKGIFSDFVDLDQIKYIHQNSIHSLQQKIFFNKGYLGMRFDTGGWRLTPRILAELQPNFIGN
jgi:hypothetical protein